MAADRAQAAAEAAQQYADQAVDIANELRATPGYEAFGDTIESVARDQATEAARTAEQAQAAADALKEQSQSQDPATAQQYQDRVGSCLISEAPAESPAQMRTASLPAEMIGQLSKFW